MIRNEGRAGPRRQACVPQGPVDAIDHEDEAGPDLLADLQRNAAFFQARPR
ncbi:hypothetical protein DB30_06181 [Enhygromyxa salina]|uniref:Uncharacterized protein n=1 Tax=Enhygromyxa salina TaxID=215803 RepID=A0A0C2D4H4_9BACT|nr:hypothetical protein DB30_06181 [Enhygromyxa salina]